MYHVASYFDVPFDRHRDFIAAALENRCHSLAHECGTRRFELIKDANNENRFCLDEAYDDEVAFETHKKGPHFKRFFEIIGGFAKGPTSLIGGTDVEGFNRGPYCIDPCRAEEPRGAEKSHFIGPVKMQRLGEGVRPVGVDVVVVFFECGARTRPHIHPVDQVLHIISGTGFVAFPGQEDQEIEAGGVVIVPAGALHMHGATNRGRMCHLAIKAAGETDWAPSLPAQWSGWGS